MSLAHEILEMKKLIGNLNISAGEKDTELIQIRMDLADEKQKNREKSQWLMKKS